MGKKKTETKEQSHSQVTPQVPEWITNPVQGYLGRVQAFGQMDPYSLVPGASPLQGEAFDLALQRSRRGRNPLALDRPDYSNQRIY